MKLAELARVVRSKNAGPTLLTLDLMFPDAAAFDRARGAPALAGPAVARRYGVPANTVRVIPYPAAHAIKIVIDRPVIAGDPGDGDVYGAQQHRALLEIEL